MFEKKEDSNVNWFTGRVKSINGTIATVSIRGTLVNVTVPSIDCVLRKNQRVTVGNFNGDYRIIG